MTFESFGQYFVKLLIDIANTDVDVALFAILAVCTAMVLDSVSMFSRKKKEQIGLESKTSRANNGSVQSLPFKRYYSEIQGLAGTPDAVIIENGFFIPVERKPTSNKIRDRYIAQLLIYMRLIEEFEGKRPPYGYLILGKNHRRVKIENTQQRQDWLQNILHEMRDVLNERAKVKPTPHYRKCAGCSMRTNCDHVQLPREHQQSKLKVVA